MDRKKTLCWLTVAAFTLFASLVIASTAYAQEPGGVRGVDVGLTLGKLIGGFVGLLFFVGLFGRKG